MTEQSLWWHATTGVQWDPIAQVYTNIGATPELGDLPVAIYPDSGFMWDPNSETWSPYPPVGAGPVIDSLDMTTSYANATDQNIEVLGTDFPIDAYVYIDGVQMADTSNWNSATDMSVSVPPTAGPGDHTLQVQGSTGNSNTMTFTLTAGSISVTGCTPASYAYGVGQSLTVTGVGLTGVNAVSTRSVDNAGGYSGWTCTGETVVDDTSLTCTTTMNVPRNPYYIVVHDPVTALDFWSTSPLLTVS
jgi:hypothetical protein